MAAVRTRSIYAIVLAGILLVSGIYLWINASAHDAQVERALSEYEAALERYKIENIYYTPKDIVHYARVCQNPNGYFVSNPDLIFEPLQLNKNTMSATRFAVVTLGMLNSTGAIDRKATINYIMGNYVENIQFTNTSLGYMDYPDDRSYAGFRTLPDVYPGVRTTLDALMALESLDALDDPRLDLGRVKNFILFHHNPDGGFWDEDYAKYGKNSTLICTSFALRVLGRINQYQGKEFNADFKDSVAGFVRDCFDESDGGYANNAGGESNETYGTFRAFISLWWLGGNNDLQRKAFVEQNMDLEKNIDYLYEILCFFLLFKITKENSRTIRSTAVVALLV